MSSLETFVKKDLLNRGTLPDVVFLGWPCQAAD